MPVKPLDCFLGAPLGAVAFVVAILLNDLWFVDNNKLVYLIL